MVVARRVHTVQDVRSFSQRSVTQKKNSCCARRLSNNQPLIHAQANTGLLNQIVGIINCVNCGLFPSFNCIKKQQTRPQRFSLLYLMSYGYQQMTCTGFRFSLSIFGDIMHVARCFIGTVLSYEMDNANRSYKHVCGFISGSPQLLLWFSWWRPLAVALVTPSQLAVRLMSSRIKITNAIVIH